MKKKYYIQAAGFTLVELLVAIFIIAILSTIALTILPQVGDRMKYQKSKAIIALLENSLESYYFDNNVYPAAIDLNNWLNSDVLFQVLGGYDSSGNITLGSNGKAVTSYADYMDPNGSGKLVQPGVPHRLVDPFGNEIRYVDAASTTAGGTIPHTTHNPDFDLWIVGKDGVDEYRNADAVDDIRNWQ